MSLAVLAVGVGALGLSGCVGGPSPRIGTAISGDGSAVVSWQAPPWDNPAPIVGYVVTPWVGQVAQTPVRFNSTATTQTVTGLTNGTTYTFTVRAVNALGQDSASSGMSNPVMPAPLTAVALDAGSFYTCAVLVDGTAKCWGSNAYGQLGNDTTTSCPPGPCSTTPVAVTGITTASAISAGGDARDGYLPTGAHTCARLTSGTLMCWGSGDAGQLGNGSFGTSSTTPVAVTGITTATAVAAGASHSCALLTGGTVKCWGAGGFGALGNGDTADAATPVAVTGISTATAISAGDGHSCALLADGTVECWGSNSVGQLGDGTTTDQHTPVAVSGITTAIAISGGFDHSCALLSGGTVKCWGNNGYWQLGTRNPPLAYSATPVTATGVTTATAVTSGGFRTCVLLADGTVNCWGDNSGYEVGIGTDTAPGAPVTGITGAIAVTAGSYHVCALLPSRVRCWGNNGYGELGNGTTTYSSTPVTVIGI